MATTTTKTEDKDDGDWLGYGVYAETLWARIERALDKTDLGDDPLVIGLFGEWGAGKSYLLNMMKDEAKSWAKDRIGMRKQLGGDGVVLTVPVLFQPWKYEHEEHLLVPMMLHILYALQEYTSKTRTNWDKAGGVTEAAWEGVKKSIPKVVGLFEKATKGAIAVMEPHTAVAAGIGLGVAKSAAGLIKPREDKPNVHKNYKNSNDGRFYYELHQTLTDVTRPTREKGLLKEHFNYPFRLNFVVFIDDLDRCLPEKAVQTLEMIKTVFNIDSFAFVLALDDEVIERGIAHRYIDYALVDKKQQMPITGFEYLEKIVHLPFRLPQLTKPQAQAFLAFEENRIAGNKQTWFTVQSLAKYDGTFAHDGSLKHDGSLARSKNLEQQETRPMVASVLTGLFLASFEAYVPRKMVRVIELMHQIAHITAERGKPLSAPHSNIDDVVPEVAGGRDIRVVFTLLMLQLFQPELFRLLRRKEAAFPTLLAAFASEFGGLSGNEISEIDLWTWATFRKQDDVSSKVSNASEALAGIATETQSLYNAQQIRLPVVTKLVEHLQVQRHVFNPLKLINALAKSLGESAKALQIAGYFSLLGEQTATPISGHASMNLEPATMGVPTFDRSNDIQSLVDAITERDTGGQANLASRLELPALLEGKKLSRETSQKLHAALESWLTSSSINGKEGHLLQGLSHISPWVDWHLGGKDLWALVSNEIETEAEQWGTLIKLAPALSRMKNAFWFNDSKTLDIVRAVLLNHLTSTGLKPEPRAQVGNALGMIGDPRFKGKYASAVRQDGDAPEAPAGFVTIKAGKFQIDSKEDSDNPIKTVEYKHDYYISRYSVTVAQYAAFVDAKAYEDQNLWQNSSKQGWQWRTGVFDSAKTLEGEDQQAYKDWLERRPADLRRQPMDWAEQLAHPNRPVTGVTWFEATAYAAWLEQQRQKREGGAAVWGNLTSPNYRLRLPTEAEWERAARATSSSTVGTGKFPWGDDAADIDQRANIDHKVGHPTTVGSYPPNSVGLYDMVGNVWQWQANLYSNTYNDVLISAKDELKLGKTWQTSDRPSLRGGSWASHPDFARCSFRVRSHPDSWDGYVGFRLVLSLADL